MSIAGRGPLDAAAAAILAQILTKHGLSAILVPHEAVSRGDIEGLDLEGVAMVCAAYLEVTGSPSHLRYLLQRLRERVPTAKLLVGLFPENDVLFEDPSLRRELGANFLCQLFAGGRGDLYRRSRKGLGRRKAICGGRSGGYIGLTAPTPLLRRDFAQLASRLTADCLIGP